MVVGIAHRSLMDDSLDRDDSLETADYVGVGVTIVGLVFLLVVRLWQCRDHFRPTPHELRERENRQMMLMYRTHLRSLGILPYDESNVRRLSVAEAEDKRKQWKALIEEQSLSTVRTLEA